MFEKLKVTFILADMIRAVNIQSPIRVDRDTDFTNVRVEFSSIKPIISDKKGKKNVIK